MSLEATMNEAIFLEAGNEAGAALLQRVVSSDVLIDPFRSANFLRNLAALAAHERYLDMVQDRASDDDDFWPEPDDWTAQYRPYRVVNSVLRVPVTGSLINQFGYTVAGWVTGYQYIERAVARGMADSNVQAIALEVDSPGGEVPGCFELTDKIYNFRSEKPIVAFASYAASAAFSLASAADQVVAGRSSFLGSVGVVTMHTDMSQRLDQMGVKVTLIYAGKHKVDGNRFEPLPETVRDRIQSRIDKTYGLFVSTVARNRGMSDEAVRKTEALTYDAEESVEVGFADRVGDLDQEMSALTDAAADEEDEELMMSDKTTDKTSEITPESLAAAVDAGKAEATSAAMENERERWGKVLGSEECDGREKLAQNMLKTTDLAADKIIAILADAPKAEAPAPQNETSAFASQMDKEGSPNVGSDATGGSDVDRVEAVFESAGMPKKKT